MAAPGQLWSGIAIVDHAPCSQFDGLQELGRARCDGPGAVACLALTGEGFHGHRSRSWRAERGNLHLSVALPPRVPAGLLPGLTMLPAVAVVDAVRSLTGETLQLGIKWVNDVLWQGRKVAGVLTATQTRELTVEWAVLGIGVNVACRPSVTPTPFVPAVGCLAEAGFAQPRPLPSLFWAVLSEIARGYTELASRGVETLLTRYRQASVVLGQLVRIYDETFGELDPTAPWPETLAQGEVVAIDSDLGLRLAGQTDRVIRGRLAFEAVCRTWGR